MPPKNYSNLTVRNDILKKLEELRLKLGFGSYSDLLVFLVNTYEEYTRISSRLTSISSKLDEILTRISSIHTRDSSISLPRNSSKLVAPATPDYTRNSSNLTRNSSISSQESRTGYRKGKTRAIDILRDEKVIYEADVVDRIKDRDAFFERLRRDGAVVVETTKQRIAVDPSFWEEFKKRLEEADTTNDEVLKEQLGEDGLKLLKVLREEGVVYFNGVKRKWEFIAGSEGE